MEMQADARRPRKAAAGILFIFELAGFPADLYTW
jgi:uncharacterized membrane protein